MPFDFTNYTFSGLLSILASLYGVGYPLIVQNIGQIHTQYDSERLSKRFVKEPIYRLFQILMLVNMVAAVLAPFLLLQQKFNLCIITIQAILIVALVGDSILLFRLILTYHEGSKLFALVRGEKIDKDNVLDLLDLAIYADSHHQYRFYFDCMSYVFAYIEKQQGDKPDQPFNTILPPVFYDEVTSKIVLKIKDFLKSDDGHHYMYGNNDIVSVMYNQNSASRLSLQCHQWMWLLLSEAVANNNHSWFSQYWQSADNYASIKYYLVGCDSPLNHDRLMFMMRHVMIGAMLIHHGRIRWLNETFFYTHSEPEYYGLIPSRFEEIILVLEMIDMMCNDIGSRYYYQQGFYFKDQMGGVKANKFAFKEALSYLSLLVIRLWSMEGRNLLGMHDVFALPASPNKLRDEEREAQLMDMIKGEVKRWMDKHVFDEIPRMSAVEYDKVEKLLDDYKNQCISDKQEKENHPKVNSKKFEMFKEEMIEGMANVGKNLPSKNEYEGSVSEEVIVEKEEVLKTIEYSGYLDIGVNGVPSAICSNYKFDIDRAYVGFIEKQKCLGGFFVPRAQIRSLLDGMGYNEQYAIIVTEEFAELKDAEVVLETMYRPIYFYVVKKDEIPSIRMMAMDNESLKPLSVGGVIYTNIDDFQLHQEPQFIMKLKTKLKFSKPKEFSGFVRFVVDDNYLRRNVKVKVENTFTELFGES